MSDSITIINEGDQKVVKVVRLTRPDEGTGFDAATLAETIHAATEKGTIADDDEVSIADSAATYGLKRWKWSTIAAAISSLISSAISALSLGNAATKNVGTTANTVAAGDDSRMSNARTPTAHKSSHATGGADAIAPSDIGAATTAQGALADSAVQPNTSPTFAEIITPIISSPTSTQQFRVGATQVGSYDNSSWYMNRSLQMQGSAILNLPAIGLTWGAGASIWLKRDAGATGALVISSEQSSDVPSNVILRDLTATRYLRPASYTVAAANALVGVPTGAVVTISNETGGMVLAQYDGSAWKRQTDLAMIS